MKWLLIVFLLQFKINSETLLEKEHYKLLGSIDKAIANASIIVSIEQSKDTSNWINKYPYFTDAMLLSFFLFPEEEIDDQKFKTTENTVSFLNLVKSKFLDISPHICLLDSSSVTKDKCLNFFIEFFDSKSLSLKSEKIFRTYLNSNFDKTEEISNLLDTLINSDLESFKYIGLWIKKATELIINYHSEKIDLAYWENFGMKFPSKIGKYDLENIENVCFDRLFLKIKRDLPNYFLKSKIKEFNVFSEHINKLKNSCDNAIYENCKSVFIVKSIAIYVYTTIECENREVTANDIRNDIQEWRELNFTEAQILQHSKLIDDIEFCQDAYNSNYVWDFKTPEIKKGCKSKNK